MFTTQLLGWDADHLHVAAILKQYRLKSLHARSSMGERGLELRPNPRNGLSFTSYRGGEGASVQLDGVPQVRGGEEGGEGMQGRSGLEAGPLASSLSL